MNHGEATEAACEIAQAVVEKLGPTDAGRIEFSRRMGSAEFNTISAAEGIRIWEEALPTPPPPPERRWHRPETPNRQKVVDDLVANAGLGPISLADAVLRLIDEGGWDPEKAIAWGREEIRVAIAARLANSEPWVAKASALIGEGPMSPESELDVARGVGN